MQRTLTPFNLEHYQIPLTLFQHMTDWFKFQLLSEFTTEELLTELKNRNEQILNNAAAAEPPAGNGGAIHENT